LNRDLVQVPAKLLLSPDLSASAKLIWMVARSIGITLPGQAAPGSAAPGPAAPGMIASLSLAAGLSRPTVRDCLACLARAGWASTGLATVPPRPHVVPVPAPLIIDRKLSTHARVLYGHLLLTRGFAHPSGRFTLANLADQAHISRNTAEKALLELAHAEWIKLEREHRKALIHFELTFPGFARGLEALARAQDRLSVPGPYGESLMREFLTLLIDSDEYDDDAAPGFLVNPRTQGRLEFDRFYPPQVAFELNGPQHYRATKRFTAEQVGEQQERDYIKIGICATRGITLVILRPEDLTLEMMRQKVGSLLPLRDLTGYELLIDYLEQESADYRRRMVRI
jgi:hypothetical protein